MMTTGYDILIAFKHGIVLFSNTLPISRSVFMTIVLPLLSAVSHDGGKHILVAVNVLNRSTHRLK